MFLSSNFNEISAIKQHIHLLVHSRKRDIKLHIQYLIEIYIYTKLYIKLLLKNDILYFKIKFDGIFQEKFMFS